MSTLLSHPSVGKLFFMSVIRWAMYTLQNHISVGRISYRSLVFFVVHA